jgi:hypothetical protein
LPHNLLIRPTVLYLNKGTGMEKGKRWGRKKGGRERERGEGGGEKF